MANKQVLTSTPARRGGGRGPMGPGLIEKPKNFGKAMKDLIAFCKPYLSQFVIAIVFACFASLVSLIGPNKISEIVNEISLALKEGRSINSDIVIKIAIVLLSLYVLSAVLSYIQSFMMITITQKISKNLRTQISVKMNKLHLKFLDSKQVGDTLSVITNDVDSVATNMNNCISSLFSSVVSLVGCLLLMFLKNWILAFCAIGSSLIGFVFMRLIVSGSQKYFIKQQNELGYLNGYVEETYTGHTIIKVSNAGDECKKEFNASNDALKNSSWKAQFLSGLMGPLMQFMGNFGFVVVSIVGALLCASGRIDIGTIAAFIIYVKLFSSPLNTIGQSATSLQTVAASSERVFAFLNEKEMDDESHKTAYLNPAEIKGDVEFRNVNFGYNENVPIIKNFSAVVRAGQKVAIVGPTGAGKTTLVNLLMRFYEVGSGDIFIDGVNIKDLTRENVHDIFSMVLQDTWIFDGTIKNNIVFNKKDVSDESVIDVCKSCELWHLIKALPNGINTKMDENCSMSSGQRQLLTIARAMIQNSPMLILDEATSSVDTRTETQIQKAMDILMKNRTSFVIAHRLSTIKNSDLILVLKDGNVIEQGTHESLMELGGFYSELYLASFSANPV